jgi:hypothetical protein
MQKLTTRELTIDELTSEAMQLLEVGLDDLYVVLGCQLMLAGRPMQLASLISHQGTFKDIDLQLGSEPSAPAALKQWGSELVTLLEELKSEGMRFVAGVAEELAKGVSGKELLELAHDITEASMQVIVMIVGAVLKLPKQIEAVSATVAAIVSKSLARDIYA